MVPFAGWLMPVQYTSIVEENQTVRNKVGILDISQMGQLIVEGSGAREWLNVMLTNNIDKLDVGHGQYTFLLNERGGIIDDLIAYRIGEQRFLLVVNAARTDEDFVWLKKWRRPAAGAPGNVLSTQRLRFVAGTQSDRSWARSLCRSYEATLHRARRSVENKRKWSARETRPVPDEGEGPAAATALRRFPKRRTCWRSDQRHAFSKLELGHRDGVCLGGARQDRRADRHRNSRPNISRYHPKETALQKIMNVPDDLLYTETHEWARREGDKVRVGITDHAQSELTDVVYVELPKMDRQTNAK